MFSAAHYRFLRRSCDAHPVTLRSNSSMPPSPLETQLVSTHDPEPLISWATRTDDHAGTPGHAARVAGLSARLALHLGWSPPRAEQLFQATLLHDLGKLMLPRALLTQTGALHPKDRAMLETHAQLGAGLMYIAPTALRPLARSIALYHHECWDGSGYPLQRAGHSIPVEARIVTIADVFDALISERPYKRGWSVTQALRIMRANRKTRFDPTLLDAFLTLNLE
jgi:HD-GYP domain-containing protein (c-di-GMP phosphodiesterase class II)